MPSNRLAPHPMSWETTPSHYPRLVPCPVAHVSQHRLQDKRYTLITDEWPIWSSQSLFAVTKIQYWTLHWTYSIHWWFHSSWHAFQLLQSSKWFQSHSSALPRSTCCISITVKTISGQLLRQLRRSFLKQMSPVTGNENGNSSEADCCFLTLQL